MAFHALVNLFYQNNRGWLPEKVKCDSDLSYALQILGIISQVSA